jgi:hypothetical protein
MSRMLALWRLLLAALASFLASSLASSRAAYASPFDLSGHDWEGAADFVAVAKAEVGAARVIPTGQLDMHGLKREDSVIVLHPERTLDVESLSRFMRAGGRVLLLDDFGTGDALLTHFGLERVAPPRHPAEALRNNPSFAIAEPASAHPVASDVVKVVTNHPTGLKHPELSPVLKIRGNGTDEPDVLVAVAGAVGQGRLLAVGDPSIVMNSMLRYPGNKAFARGLARYAADDDTWGKRSNGKIYVVAGSFDQKGVFGDDSLLGEDWSERLRNLEDALASIRADGLPPSLAFWLAVCVAFGIILWVGTRAAKTHKPLQPRFTRDVPLVAQGGVAGHAAVIGAAHTSRVLAMLELKAALEEDLCALLGIDKNPGHEVLLAQASARALLDVEGLRTLKRLLLRLSSIETMVLSQRLGAHPAAGIPKSQQPVMQPIRDREVLQVAKSIKKILRTARARADMAKDVQRRVELAGGVP